MHRRDFLKGLFSGLILGVTGCVRTVPSDAPAPVSSPATEENIQASAQNQEDLSEENPKPPAEPVALRLAVIADMNDSYGSTTYSQEVVDTIDSIIASKPDLVINLGDMVAGQKAKLNYRAMWCAFHETVTKRLEDAGIPMAQVPGNHDASAYSAYAKEREIYIDEWNQHKSDLRYISDEHYPLYYSFEMKGFYFIALDLTTLEPMDDEQFEWFKAQLAANPTNRGAIVFSHVPLHGVSSIKPREIVRDERIAPLLREHRVQLFLTGHQHAYFPARVGPTMYMHSGAQGGGPRSVRQNAGVMPKTFSYINLYQKHEPYPETYTIEGGFEPFQYYKLPTWLIFPNYILTRFDISEEEALFAHQHMISSHMTRSQMRMLVAAIKNGTYASAVPMPDWQLVQQSEGMNSGPSLPSVLETPILRQLERGK